MSKKNISDKSQINQEKEDSVDPILKNLIPHGTVISASGNSMYVLLGNQYYSIKNSEDTYNELSKEEQITLAQERIKNLKYITEKMKSAEGLKDLEKDTIFERQLSDLRKVFEFTLSKELKGYKNSTDIAINELTSELNTLKNDNLVLKKSFIDFVSNSVFEDIARTQFIEAEIYLDSNEPDSILDAYTYIKLALNNLDFELNLELPAVFGSWYKRLIAKSKSAITSEEVTSRLKEMEYAFEVNGILKQQSEIDKNQSEALLNILKGIENTPNAVIRIGSLLVIKVTSAITNIPSIHVRTLAIKELHFLNKNPHLTNNPVELLDSLSRNNNDPDNLLN